MNMIYDKINNHEYLSYLDIARFIYIQTNGQVRTKFLKNVHDMVANIGDNCLEIRIDYKKSKLKDYKKIYENKIVLDLNDNDSSFLVDIYNLNLLFELCHELMHFRQLLLMDKCNTFRSRLLKDSYNFSYILPDMYFKNHDFYYIEYDATIKSFILTLNIIENKCKNLNTDAIIEYNRSIAMILYHSYGHMYNDSFSVSNDCNAFTSPISYSKFLFDTFGNKNDKKEFLGCIKRMEKRLGTEYMKLINGFDISDKTDRLLYDFCMDNYSTVNILDDIKKLTKRRFKTK